MEEEAERTDNRFADRIGSSPDIEDILRRAEEVTSREIKSDLPQYTTPTEKETRVEPTPEIIERANNIEEYLRRLEEADRELIEYYQEHIKPKQVEREVETQIPVQRSWRNLWGVLQYLGLAPKLRTVRATKTELVTPDVRTVMPELKRRILGCSDNLDGYSIELEEIRKSIGQNRERIAQYKEEAARIRNESITRFVEKEREMREAEELLSQLEEHLSGMRMDDPKYQEAESKKMELSVRLMRYQNEVMRAEQNAIASERRRRLMHAYDIVMTALEESAGNLVTYIRNQTKTTRETIEVTNDITPLAELTHKSLKETQTGMKHVNALVNYLIRVGGTAGIPLAAGEQYPLDIENIEEKALEIQREMRNLGKQSSQSMYQLIERAGGNGH